MKNRTAWLLVSCLMTVALPLVSCGQAVTEEEEAPAPILNLRIGETAQTPNMKLTVSEPVITDSYQYYSKVADEMRTKETPAGWSFLLVTIELENLGSDQQQVGLIKIKATDSEATNYTPIALLAEDRLAHTQELAPGKKLRGRVLFKIREEATGLKIIYDLMSLNVDIRQAEWEIDQ